MAGMGTSELRDGTLFGLAAHRVVLRCAHGGSSFVVLPGRDEAANRAAVELLWARHVGRLGCDCVRTASASRVGLPA
jgi:hypothetical protein